ncbi:Ger(x)C family spore germination protein [Negativibacillus massiliensis]|uniref:Ger(x)C family spore germination protein n=1 Tax=Negativibacillus massiliensis TaxID=1871035 RepID=UPI003AF22E95
MRKISGIFFALLIVLLPLCLTGCMNAAELKERTIIKMVGVDMDGEEYLLTMLQFSPQAQSGEKTSESQSLVIQTKGRSISEAVDQVSHYNGNKVFFGNSSFLVVGEKAAEQGLEGVLNFFNSNHEVSPELYVVMAQGQAEEVIRAQSGEGSTPTQLKSMVQQGQKNGLLGRPTLKDVMNRLQSDRAEPYLPLIETVSSENEEKKLKISGMAVFRDGKLKDTLSIEEAKGVLWATDELARAIITVDFGEDKASRASVELDNSKTKAKVRLERGKPVLDLSIQSEGSVHEVSFDRGGGTEIGELEEIQNEVAGQIKATVQHTIDKVLLKEKCDVFRYSEFIKKYEPEYWKENQQDWDEVIDQMTINISVDCRIDHPGLESKHFQVDSKAT